MTVRANSVSDVEVLARALDIATTGRFLSQEYAKVIFSEFLKVSGYDVARKTESKSPTPKQEVKVSHT